MDRPSNPIRPDQDLATLVINAMGDGQGVLPIAREG